MHFIQRATSHALRTTPSLRFSRIALRVVEGHWRSELRVARLVRLARLARWRSELPRFALRMHT